jgi:Mce-associated membrane protein
MTERQPVNRSLAAVAAAAAALFVGAAAFSAAMLQPYLADRALVNTKLDIARTAANAITSLWTYTPEDMEDLPERSAQYLGGDLHDQYRSFIDAIAPSNKQAQVTNTTQVMGAAVESLSGDDATAVVYTNTVSTSPATNNIPSLKYMSYQLDLERRGSEWLVTRMTPITTLDITPRLD